MSGGTRSRWVQHEPPTGAPGQKRAPGLGSVQRLEVFELDPDVSRTELVAGSDPSLTRRRTVRTDCAIGTPLVAIWAVRRGYPLATVPAIHSNSFDYAC